MVEHSVSPICAGVVQLTKEFALGTFGPQMVSINQCCLTYHEGYFYFISANKINH